MPFRENGWEVVEVDWDDRFGPTHVVDIATWDYTVYPQDVSSCLELAGLHSVQPR